MSDDLKLEDHLCFALYSASRAMTAAYTPLLDALDLTYPQYLVLLVLWTEDGQRVSDIGEQLHLDSATLTPLLKRLEARALIERRRSTVDERVVEVFLTAEGRRLKRKCSDIPIAMFDKAGLPLSELTRLRETLQQITQHLRGESDPGSALRRRRLKH